MARGRRAMAGAALLVTLLAACGSGDADRQETRQRLMDDIGWSDAQATCVVDGVWALDDDDVRAELTENAPDLDNEQEAALRQVMAGCGVGT